MSKLLGAIRHVFGHTYYVQAQSSLIDEKIN